MMLRDCRPSWLTRDVCLAVHMALVILFVAVPKLLAGLSARVCLGLSCAWLARTTVSADKSRYSTVPSDMPPPSPPNSPAANNTGEEVGWDCASCKKECKNENGWRIHLGLRPSHHVKSGLFFAPVFYDTLRYAKKVSEPPPRYVMTGGARLAFSDTHKHHTYRKI